jgi:FdhD protein
MSAAAEREDRGHVPRAVKRHDGVEVSAIIDRLAEEIPIALRYNHVPFAVMLATPCDLEDFALGFSVTEGLIDSVDQLIKVELRDVLEGIELQVTVADTAPAARLRDRQQRGLPGRSGCGLCGVRDLDAALRQPPAVEANSPISRAALHRALGAFSEGQRINTVTGAVHAAAWADVAGEIQWLREDVGRHNALDKLIGAKLRAGGSFESGLLLISSRASYEMVTKAAAVGIGTLVALSAPTALARDVAERCGLCLIAFARGQRFNVYTGAERLQG